MILSVPNRARLAGIVDLLVKMVPPAKRTEAEALRVEHSAICPPSDGRRRRSEETNRKVSAAFRRRREREIFTLSVFNIPGATIDVIGWANLSRAIGLSEKTISIRFAKGGGRFNLMRDGIPESFAVSRPSQFAHVTSHTGDPVAELRRLRSLFTSRPEPA
jgi:hypothetical protein